MAYITKYLYIKNLSVNETLLINTLTSAIDVIDNSTKIQIMDMINNKDEITEKNNSKLYHTLKKRGYLFENMEDEQLCVNKIEYLNKRFSINKLNTSFTICPTMGCNLRCVYCFENGSQHNDLKTLTQSQLNGIFKYITDRCIEFKKVYDTAVNKEALKTFAPKINLFGGEPLLPTNFEIIKQIFEFAKKLDIPVKIITNGTTIDYYYDLMNEFKNIISVQITMDGDKMTHDKRRVRADGKGTFDKICDGIDKILELGIDIALRINLDRNNIENLGNLEILFKEKNWINNSLLYPYVSPVQDFSGCSNEVFKESEMLRILYEKGYYGSESSFIKGIVASSIGFTKSFFESSNEKVKPWKMTYCEATSGSNYCFAPDGTITTCLTYVGKGNHYIGTFNEDGVNIIKSNYEMWMNRNVLRIDKCKDCKFAFLCGGGCPVAALEQNAAIDCSICSDIENTMDIYIEYNKEKFLVD